MSIFIPFLEVFFLQFVGGLHLISSLDSWWILELSWIYTLDSFIEKIIKIMSISTNIYRPYVYCSLYSYISSVNNSIDPITPY